MEFHPLAKIFPLIDGQAYNDLMADVLTHGIREPVWVFEDQILDGRNRWRAAQAMSVECPVREYEGTDAAGFVISMNLHRRHLTESQRAMVAAKLANLPQGANQHEGVPIGTASVSLEQAGDMLNVGRRSVARAREVLQEAPPEVAQAVEQGAMSVSLAAQVAALPEPDRAAVAAAPREQMREVARETVKAHVANNSGNNEWYTPAEYIELARQVMGGIDTDPASSEIANGTVKAGSYFTVDDDGLSKAWTGRVWMNPPYAQPLIADFADALATKFEDGEIEQACVLVNNGTETAWFQRLLSVASAVCFPRSRIRFIDPSGAPSGAPLQGQAVIYVGESVEAFHGAFSQKGAVLTNG